MVGVVYSRMLNVPSNAVGIAINPRVKRGNERKKNKIAIITRSAAAAIRAER